ncbi:MAG: hypothetical protein RIT04_538 [Candidatus Parcubacteria bacterium]|jgi:membrane-associated protein
MDLIHTFLSFISPANIIASLGVIGIIAVVFAESGLFFGFFLPGDSLLFTAGFLASTIETSGISLIVVLIGSCIAAIVGDSVGYAFGKSLGQRLYSRPDSRFFKQKHITQAREFYEKHGGKAIILARFMPIVRTFAPIVAGAAGMRYKSFLSYNVIGGFVWSFGMTLLGYFFGKSIPNATEYVTPIVIAIIVVSFLPAIYHLIKSRI